MNRKPTLVNAKVCSTTRRSRRCWTRHDRASDEIRILRGKRPNGRRHDRARAIALGQMKLVEMKWHCIR